MNVQGLASLAMNNVTVQNAFTSNYNDGRIIYSIAPFVIDVQNTLFECDAIIPYNDLSVQNGSAAGGAGNYIMNAIQITFKNNTL